jgi:hypothetical protein
MRTWVNPEEINKDLFFATKLLPMYRDDVISLGAAK